MTTTATSKLYLSRLLLNPRSRQVWSELAQPYEMHRTLMRAFPPATKAAEGTAREEFAVLFRAEFDDSGGVAKVYVQSVKEPDWSFLQGLPDYLCRNGETPSISCKDVMPSYANLRAGQTLRFRLRANPSKKAKRNDEGVDLTKPRPGTDRLGRPKAQSKRVELTRESEQIDWLIRKGKEREKGVPGGFELLFKEARDRSGQARQIPRVTVCPEGKEKGRKREGAGGHVTIHLAVLFDGLLRVTDAEQFRKTLTRGIGSGKAFGFGLLSVAPCSSAGL
jgi:CRISPR system Cascade subunit CasE